jgi:hypothetical protein
MREILLRRSLAAAIGVVLLLGLGGWLTTLLPIADPLPPPLQGWRTVGSYFDHPPAWPGKPWMKQGRTIDKLELEAAAGPSHCGWDSATFLNLGWPLGTIAADAGQDRLYVRDPGRTIQGATLLGSWEHDPALPADAKDTGYRYGAIKLYLAYSDQDYFAYLLAPADSERWPRSDPMTLCA